MKKLFEEPVVDILPFNVEDIITASAPGEGDNGTGWG